MKRPSDSLTLTEQELLYRLGWFTRMRWVIGGLVLLMLLASWYVLGVRFHTPDGTDTIGRAVDVVLLVFLYNAVFVFLIHVYRQRGQVSRRIIVAMALTQIACDMTAICSVIHFVGGIENFFIVLILLPLVIATELLPRPLAYGTAVLAVGLVHALAWLEQQKIWPHVRVVWPGGQAGTRYLEPLYVLEVTTALTILILVTVFVGSSISARLRFREQEVEDAYDRLSEIDEAKGLFMQQAGHDLRAPLVAIHSLLGAIKDDQVQPPNRQHQQLIDRAQRRTRAMLAMVDDLRKYSQLRSLGVFLSMSQVSLSDIAETIVGLFQEQARSVDVRLRCRVQEANVEGDEKFLREVVTNLVANALQYTPAGGRVDVSARLDGDQGVLEVSDTGIGISEGDRDKLFQEFFRSYKARQVFPEGTGMGLVICKRIIEMHHGSIAAHPGPEGGTTFSVWLPRSAEHTDHARPPD